MKREYGIISVLCVIIMVLVIYIVQTSFVPYLTRIELSLEIEIRSEPYPLFDYRTEYQFKILDYRYQPPVQRWVHKEGIQVSGDSLRSARIRSHSFQSDVNLTIEVYANNTLWKTFDVVLPRIMSDKILLDLTPDYLLPVQSFRVVYTIKQPEDTIEVTFTYH